MAKVNHAMADLETMSLGNSPALVQVAAVAFDPETFEEVSAFRMNVNLQSSIDAGLEFMQSTHDWWHSDKVTQEARDRVLKGENFPLPIVLMAYKDWCAEHNVKALWGNGVRADNVWLESAFQAAGVRNPITYRQDMCYRTLVSLAKPNGFNPYSIKREGTFHDGLDDSRHQLKVLQNVCAALKIRIA